VDLPDTDDFVLLVHGYTGAHDRVSRHVAGYLRRLEPAAPAPLHGEWQSPHGTATIDAGYAPSEKTVASLVKRGYLTSMSVTEEEGHFARIAKRLHGQRVAAGPSYIFMPTYDCNLRCSYCFQDYMRTNPRFARLLRRIEPEMIERIFAALPELEAAYGRQPGAARSIGFFGGEPLLAVNHATVSHIIGRAKSMGPARIWAVSNATELAAYDDLLGPDGIGAIQVTLDGPPAEHDKRRIRADGGGTFDAIASNIDRCLARGVSISVRLNVDRNNINELPALADEMNRRGWSEHTGFSVYAAPIRPANAQTDVATTFDSWELNQALESMHREMPSSDIIRSQDDGLMNRARQVFDDRTDPIPEFRTSFCSAHTTMYIFDPFGDIYACWERTGDARIRIGNVADDGRIHLEGPMQKLWRTRTVASNPTCRKCRYALHCGGGCAVLAEGQSGRFHSNYCDGFAERFRHSVAEAYQESLTGIKRRRAEAITDL
ncbi:MAG TPA: radical SAM protein, partial [Gemmatimonadaceae bacterium]